MSTATDIQAKVDDARARIHDQLKLADRRAAGIRRAARDGDAAKANARRADRQAALTRVRALRLRIAAWLKRLANLTPTSVSSRGAGWIAEFEGYYPYAYNDPAGYATAWIGHLLHLSAVTSADKAKWGDSANRSTWATMDQMVEFFRHDLEPYTQAVLDKFHVSLTQEQLDGFVSFAFNLGPGAIDDFVGRINSGESICTVASQELPKYVHAGGVVYPGLVRRRSAEVHLICNGVYATS